MPVLRYQSINLPNHEQETTTYAVEIQIDGQPAVIYYGGESLSRLENIELPQDGNWEDEIGFAPQHSGESQKVEFFLYKDGATTAEETLHLWVDVTE